MKKKLIVILAFILLTAGFSGFAHAAKKKKKLINRWNAANEIYFILPLPQEMRFQGDADATIVHPWGFGLRSVGNNEGFSGTGGLQVQSVRVNLNPDINSFYVFDLFMGLEYITPKVENKPFRYIASALGGFGLSSGDFFMTSIISAGVLYTTEEDADTPVGLSFNLFYRLTETDLINNSDKRGLIEPSFGFKIGYIFKGFWAVEEI